MNLKKILLKAADKIDKFGWIRGAYGNELIGYCIGEAIHASGGRRDLIGERDLDTIRLALGFRNRWELPKWNDQPERTKEQVIERLQLAASLLGPHNE